MPRRIGELVLRHPEVTVVCNAKTHTMMQNFFTFDIDSRVQLVKEMDTLTTGRHTFAFVMAPMVHWPEVMVSYDTTDQNALLRRRLWHLRRAERQSVCG